VESHFREQGLRLLIVDRWVDNNVIAFLPVDGGGDLVLIAELQRYWLVNKTIFNES
jgi:hypothetical protein